MAKKKFTHKLTAWEMYQISESAANKRGDKFLLEALKLCKKRAELGYYYAEYEQGLGVRELMQLSELGYTFNTSTGENITIRWSDVKDPKKR